MSPTPDYEKGAPRWSAGSNRPASASSITRGKRRASSPRRRRPQVPCRVEHGRQRLPVVRADTVRPQVGAAPGRLDQKREPATSLLGPRSAHLAARAHLMLSMRW